MRAKALRTFPLLVILGGPAAFAQGAVASNNVSLDNLTFPARDNTTVTIKHIDVTGTNALKEDIAKLFDPSTPKSAVADAAAKLTADKIVVPDAVVAFENGSVTLHGIAMTNVNQGKVNSVTVSGADGGGKTERGDAFTLKGRQLDLKNVDFSKAFQAFKDGDLASSMMRATTVTWQGFEATIVDRDTPADAAGGNLIKASLASFAGQSAYDGDIPATSSGKAEHIVVAFPKASNIGKQLAAFGFDGIDAGLTFAGSYDKAKKTMAIDNYTFTAANAGALTIKGGVGNVDPSFFTAKGKPKLNKLIDADIDTLSLNYADNGLFAKVAAYFATQHKTTVDQVKADWSTLVGQFLPLILGGDPASLVLAQAVDKFIADPKSLTIAIKGKNGPVPVTDFMDLSDPKSILSKINLTAVAGP